MIDLRQPEYVHVVLNPLPLYGLAAGALALLIALGFQRGARVTALVVVAVCSVSAWPVHHFGEEAYDRVRAMSDRDGEKWLDEHMRRAEQWTAIFFVTAAIATAGIVSEYKFPRAAVPIALVTLIFAVVSVATGGYIAHAGGRVRHKEFRYSPPP
jgi:uncharacterized membrane protein